MSRIGKKPVTVPAGIGINTEDPEVIYFDDNGSYGGIDVCAQPCISPLHTHDASGILQVRARDAQTGTEQSASLDLIGGVPQQDVAASRERLQQLRR